MDTFDENWEDEHRNKKSKGEPDKKPNKWDEELRKEADKWDKERKEKESGGSLSEWEKILKKEELNEQVKDLDPKTADEVLEYANEAIKKVMSNSNYKEKKSMVDNKTIPFLGGRPLRDTVISGDDIVNLNIALNTCSTLEEFFLQV